jgi:hypothetical protein
MNLPNPDLEKPYQDAHKGDDTSIAEDIFLHCNDVLIKACSDAFQAHPENAVERWTIINRDGLTPAYEMIGLYANLSEKDKQALIMEKHRIYDANKENDLVGFKECAEEYMQIFKLAIERDEE